MTNIATFYRNNTVIQSSFDSTEIDQLPRGSTNRRDNTHPTFITSLTQAVLAVSLAISMITFVVSILELVPQPGCDSPTNVALKFNSLFCLIIPLILAYCLQSKTLLGLPTSLRMQRCGNFVLTPEQMVRNFVLLPAHLNMHQDEF